MIELQRNVPVKGNNDIRVVTLYSTLYFIVWMNNRDMFMFYVLHLFTTVFFSVPGVSEQSSGFRVHLHLAYIIHFYIYILYAVTVS